MTTHKTLEERLADLERRVDALESKPASFTAPASPAPKALSPREFLIEKAPTTMLDKTLLAGYWWEIVQGHEWFTLDDIEEFLRRAKESPPKNRRDAAFQNVKRGTFREEGVREQSSHAKNRWSITNPGIKLVEQGFPKR